jgi:hypothetical protein
MARKGTEEKEGTEDFLVSANIKGACSIRGFSATKFKFYF